MKRKKDKNTILVPITIIIICLFLGPLISYSFIFPKDNLKKDSKEYYIKQSIAYFNDTYRNYASLNELSKKGYVRLTEDFNVYDCNKYNSYVLKEDDNTINLIIECDKFNSFLKVKYNTGV